MYFHSSQENFSWLLTFYNLGFRTLGYACCFWNEWFGWKKGLCLLGDLASSSIAEKSSQNKHCGTRDCTATCSLSHSHERSFPFPFLCWRKWNMTARFLSFTHKLPRPHPLHIFTWRMKWQAMDQRTLTWFLILRQTQWRTWPLWLIFLTPVFSFTNWT